MNLCTRRARTLCALLLVTLLLLCLTACRGFFDLNNDDSEAEPGTFVANDYSTETDIESDEFESESDSADEQDSDADSTDTEQDSVSDWETESGAAIEIVTETETKPPIDTESETKVTVESEKQPDGTLPFVPDHPEVISNDWKAIWISQFDLKPALTTSDGAQRSEAELRTQMSTILDNVAGDGFNTVILQMRPNSDSMYPSSLYPPSAYAVGDYGADFAYDPITVILEMCHERGLSVHAWINPLRSLTEENMQKIPDTYLVKQWYNDPEKNGRYIVSVNGTWYFNPAEPEVRNLITDGVSEILHNYDVDGVHMDDYFYPTTDESFDTDAYAAYVADGGKATLADWRRTNLSAMMAELYATVKAHDLRALFGISPAGNLTTVHNDHFADIYTWCSTPGYIDYVCPQIYFGFEHQNYDFVKVCNNWSNIIKTDYVNLIIGLTFHKAANAADGVEDPYAGTGAREWLEHTDILARSLSHTETLDKCVGVTVFCYQHMFDLTTGEPLDKTAAEHAAFAEKLATVTWHKKNDTRDS